MDVLSPRVLNWLAPLLALALSACSDKPPQAAAPAAPPVTVAQPVKRTVTDWDEFTGRFEAVQEVQVRARVGGFVTSVEFRDGAIVLICQPCLSEFGFKLDDIVPGVQLGAPGYLENFVFADNVRTLTW